MASLYCNYYNKMEYSLGTFFKQHAIRGRWQEQGVTREVRKVFFQERDEGGWAMAEKIDLLENLLGK